MSLAVFVSVLSAIGFGATIVLARLGLQRVPPTFAVFVSLCSGFLLTFLVVLALHLRDVFELSPRAFLWFTFYAIITFPLARLSNYIAISLAGASRTAPLLAISPILSTLLALITLGERPNLMIVLGILVSVMGMVLILSERRSDAA